MCVASLKKLFGRVWENSQQEAFVLQMHCLPLLFLGIMEQGRDTPLFVVIKVILSWNR